MACRSARNEARPAWKKRWVWSAASFADCSASASASRRCSNAVYWARPVWVSRMALSTTPSKCARVAWVTASASRMRARAPLVGTFQVSDGPKPQRLVDGSPRSSRIPTVPMVAPMLMFGYSSPVATPIPAVAAASRRSACRTSGRRLSNAAPSPTGTSCAIFGSSSQVAVPAGSWSTGLASNIDKRYSPAWRDAS
ncbi:hypothetical protein D3C73_1140300 [compost metagenome]